MRLFLTLALFAAHVFAADKHTIAPTTGPKPIGPYSPGISAGKYLYISGQGVRTRISDDRAWRL